MFKEGDLVVQVKDSPFSMHDFQPDAYPVLQVTRVKDGHLQFAGYVGKHDQTRFRLLSGVDEVFSRITRGVELKYTGNKHTGFSAFSKGEKYPVVNVTSEYVLVYDDNNAPHRLTSEDLLSNFVFNLDSAFETEDYTQYLLHTPDGDAGLLFPTLEDAQEAARTNMQRYDVQFYISEVRPHTVATSKTKTEVYFEAA